MDERRKDRETAELFKRALRTQRELGFEPAFLLLRAHGVAVDLARSFLMPYHDRRLHSATPDASSTIAQ